MDKYYVDKRIMEIVKSLDTSYMAPELYYEYLCGRDDHTIVEKWACGNQQFINFYVDKNEPHKALARKIHMENHKANPIYLESYTVPKSWFDEEIKKLEE